MLSLLLVNNVGGAASGGDPHHHLVCSVLHVPQLGLQGAQPGGGGVAAHARGEAPEPGCGGVCGVHFQQ
jgi:hypothetical protein